MMRKIGILILIGIISMCTVIPIALADNNDQDVDDVITVEDEGENIFKMNWNKITSTLSFSENGEEPTINVEEEHQSGKTSHGAIVSIIAKITNKLESVIGKTHGMIMRAIAKTNWGKQIEDKDSLEDKEEKGKPEKGKNQQISPQKKSIEVLDTVFDMILGIFNTQKEVLIKVKDEVPPEAQLAIQRAIDNNERKIERMEGIKARVLERVNN
ncbi:MAG: hypothetical protein KKC53_02285 [Actinobacteria bacterium]|nr:hypothetical protein [Actinomycetota bacterium]